MANTLLQQQGLTKAAQLRVRQITGFRQGQTSLHGQGLAIDIDAATNPYIINEYNETALDKELIVVYERIAQFMLGRTSIIPYLGAGYSHKQARRDAVARLYDVLAQESVAMQRYFTLMQEGERLQEYVHTAQGAQRSRLSATFLSLFPAEKLRSKQTPAPPFPPVANATIDQLRLRMMSDWVTLTGHAGPAVRALARPDTTVISNDVYLQYPLLAPGGLTTAKEENSDRPFDPKGRAYPGRSPLNGFLTLRKELVLALIDSGLRWGALDFGRTSGDLMHFDSRETTCRGTEDHEAAPLDKKHE